MRPLPSKVTLDEILVLIEITGEDTVHGIVIDDGTLCRNDTISKEETGTEAMDIPYKHILRLFLSHPLIDTFAHAACCPVGEGET